MRVGKRLEKILSLVDKNLGVVVDVGTDHGILAYKILVEKSPHKVIATDISAPSLEKARELKVKHNLKDEFVCLVGDGLHPVQTEPRIDLVIIAGMGGYEIVKIMKETENKQKFGEFIFQPMQDCEILREYLLKEGWLVSVDETVKDRNKFYSTIKCAYTGIKKEFAQKQIFVGCSDMQNMGADFLEWVEFEISALLKREQYLTPEKQSKLKILKAIQLENEENKK